VTDYRLSRAMRLSTQFEFARVYDQRNRVGDRHLLVFAAQNELDLTRFGLSVSKKHGMAVRRTKLKRLLREAFRLSQHELPRGLDLVLIPRQQSRACLEDYRKSLTRASWRLAKRLGIVDER